VKAGGKREGGKMGKRPCLSTYSLHISPSARRNPRKGVGEERGKGRGEKRRRRVPPFPGRRRSHGGPKKGEKEREEKPPETGKGKKGILPFPLLPHSFSANARPQRRGEGKGGKTRYVFSSPANPSMAALMIPPAISR